MSIYPITAAELDAAENALINAEDGCASVTSRVHAVLGAIQNERDSNGRIGDLTARLKAFGRDCVTHGDMSPAGERMLNKILTTQQHRHG